MNTYEKALKLYKKTNTLIVSLVDNSGFPHTKAVLPTKYKDSIKEIYFCTNTSSHFAEEIIKNPKSSIYFFTRGLIWKGCYLKGEMQIVTDLKEKEKFWQNKFKNAYPEKSPSDPDFCVIKFTAYSGRFYSWFKPEDFEI